MVGMESVLKAMVWWGAIEWNEVSSIEQCWLPCQFLLEFGLLKALNMTSVKIISCSSTNHLWFHQFFFHLDISEL